MVIKKEATVTVFVSFILLCLSITSVSALIEVIECAPAEMLGASIYTTPANEQDINYGDWTGLLNRDTDCTPQTCLGAGINDPANVNGNKIFQEFGFEIPQDDIRELLFDFSACWSGGEDGCGHDDHPEYAPNDPGKAEVQAFNGTHWNTFGDNIELGHISMSRVMGLANYSRTINFTSNLLDKNKTARIRVQSSGTFFGKEYDVEMYTDYAGLKACYVKDRIGQMNITVENSEGAEQNVTLELNGATKQKKTGKKNEMNASLGNYSLTITPQGKIKSINVSNFSHKKDGNYHLKLDNPVDTDWVQAFAIDTSALNASAAITVQATGDMLYFCNKWNFTSSTCTGTWTPVKKIDKGKDYNVTAMHGCFKERSNYDVSQIQAKGITGLDIIVNNESIKETDSYKGTKTLEVVEKNETVLVFKHDFDEEDINLSSIKLVKAPDSLIVSLASEVAPGTKKTLYFADKGYYKLCVKNSEINSTKEITSNCNGTNEINFDSCINKTGGVTVSGVTCYDEGKRFRIENLAHSGIIGKLKNAIAPKSSSGGSGGGGGGSNVPACNDNKDNDNDGLKDYPADPGCDSKYDKNEYNYPQHNQTNTQPNPANVEAVEPIEIKVPEEPPAQDQAKEPEAEKEDSDNQGQISPPTEQITQTKKYTKLKYGGISIITMMISMIIVFMILRRDNKPDNPKPKSQLF